MKKTVASLFIIITIMFLSLPAFANQSVSSQTNDMADISVGSVTVPDISAQSAEKTRSEPLIYSETAILIDAVSGQILFEKDMHKVMYPASITKILTALIALEKGELDQTITMSEKAVFSIERGSSHIALDTDEQITLEQALYGISIASGNDAANGIAEAVGGSMEKFALMMNERARQAGAVDSHFVNAHGLPDENHYSSAYDMAFIMKAAVELPDFLRLFSTLRYEIPPTNKQEETRYLNNANCLINGVVSCEGIIASKTGYTVAAGHTLASAARRNGRTLIAVVMNSYGKNDKFTDTAALFDYGFEEFAKVSIPAARIATTVTSDNNKSELIEYTYYSEEDVDVYLHESTSEDMVQIDFDLPQADSDEQEPAQAVLSIDASKSTGKIYPYLATHDLSVKTRVITAGADSGGNPVSAGSDNSSSGGKILAKQRNAAWLLLLPAAAALLIVFAAWLAWRRQRRLRRRRKLQRLKEMYGVSSHRLDRAE